MKKIGMYICAMMLLIGTVGCEKNLPVETNKSIEEDELNLIQTDGLEEKEVEMPSKLEVLRFWANNFKEITGEPTGVYDIGNILVMDFDCDSMPELLVEKYTEEAGLYYYDANITLDDWSEYHVDNAFGESGMPSAEIAFAFFDGINMNYILTSQNISYTEDGQECVIYGYENLSINIEDKDVVENSVSIVKYASYGLEDSGDYLTTTDSKFFDENGNEIDKKEYCNELTFHNYSKSHSKENEYIDYNIDPSCFKLAKTTDLETANLYMLFDESYKSSVLEEDTIGDYKNAIEGSWKCTKIEYSNTGIINELENESVVLESKDGVVNLSVNLDDFKEDYEKLDYCFYPGGFLNIESKYCYAFEDKTIGMAYLNKEVN